MSIGQAQSPRSIPVALQTVDGPSFEAEIFRDSNRNLVVLTKFGMNFVLDGMSALEVARLVQDVLGGP